VRGEVERVLVANSDLFTWSLVGMPNIDPDFMCHKLALLPQSKPVTQRKRKQWEERRATVELEVVQLT